MDSPWAYSPVTYIFRQLSSRRVLIDIWHCDLRFQDIRGQTAEIGVWEAKNDSPEARFDPA